MTTTRRTGAIIAGLTLAVTGIGGAIAAGADDWYAGNTSSLADHHRSTYAVTLHDASGAAVTSGSTSTVLAAFASADSRLADGDTHAQLFVHLPVQGTASGTWTGVQTSRTDAFTGAGATSAPNGVAGKAYVGLAGGYTVADVVAALPNTATSGSWAGVYELRLRTSAATGVSDDYASTWIKVSGNTWQVTTAPVAGDSGSEGPAAAVPSTLSPTWPSFTYGKAATVKVRVATTSTRPTGDVTLSRGSKRLSTARIASDGTASLTVPAAALLPGKHELLVNYAGISNSILASNAKRTVTVAKGKPGAPKVKVKTKATAKKKGKVTVSVATGSSLAKATKKVTLTLTKGKAKAKVKVTLSKGTKTISLPKLAAGTWKVSAVYSGDSRYVKTKSTSKLKVSAR